MHIKRVSGCASHDLRFQRIHTPSKRLERLMNFLQEMGHGLFVGGDHDIIVHQTHDQRTIG